MGRIFSLRMAAQGIQLAVIDQDQSALSQLAEEAKSRGLDGYIDTYCADVTELSSLLSIATQHNKTYGPIDRIVTCAAIMPTSPLAQQDAAEINKIMAINYGGTVNALSTVLPDMLKRNSGEIIVFGSSGGYLPVPECGAYVASKFASNAYMETLMEENRKSSIRFMLVCPPLVDTPLLQQATESSNPKILRESIQNKRFVSADFIIDEVEKGLRKGTKILIPGASTRFMLWLRRFSPNLLWKFIHLAE